MKVRLGPIPENSEFDPIAEQWFPIREPGPVMVQILAIPIMLLTLAVLLILIYVVTPMSMSKFFSSGFFLTLIAVAPVHELFHAIFHPQNGISNNTIIGFWPSKLAFYAHYEGSVSRNRFLAIGASPFIFLSVVPIGISALLNVGWQFLGMLSIANGIVSSADILGIIIIWYQIPKQAIVKNKGWRSYWKEHIVEAA